jgi:hypothetical protein
MCVDVKNFLLPCVKKPAAYPKMIAISTAFVAFALHYFGKRLFDAELGCVSRTDWAPTATAAAKMIYPSAIVRTGRACMFDIRTRQIFLTAPVYFVRSCNHAFVGAHEAAHILQAIAFGPVFFIFRLEPICGLILFLAFVLGMPLLASFFVLSILLRAGLEAHAWLVAAFTLRETGMRVPWKLAVFSVISYL